MKSVLSSGAPVNVKAHSHDAAEITGLDAYLPRSGGAMTGSLALAADPTAALEAATKQYVDSVASGLDVKQSVRVATTANISLTGLQTIDGVVLAANDRVLVKNQTNPADNGLYAAAASAWTRTQDADENAEVSGGMFTFVEEGDMLADTGWVLTSSPETIGTDALDFDQYSRKADTIIAQGPGVQVVQDGYTFTVSADVTQAEIDTKLDASAAAVSADRLTSARQISLTGDVTGSVMFDGSGNVSLVAQVQDYSHGHNIIDISGLQAALDSKASSSHGHALNDLTDVSTAGATTGQVLKKQSNGSYAFEDEEANAVQSVDGMTGVVNLAGRYEPLGTVHDDRYYQIASIDFFLAGKSDTGHGHAIGDVSGLQTSLDSKLGATENAVSATKLATARSISVIGDATGGVLFDGTGNVSINLGINDDSHNHIISNVDGLQAALDGKSDTSHGHVTGDIQFHFGSVDADSYDQGQFFSTRHNTADTTDPPGSYYHIANLGGDGTARGTQIASHFGAGDAFKIRRRSDNTGAPNGAGNWQPWRRIWTEFDFDPANFLDTGGNAASASQLQTGRTIALGGDLSGSVIFDGTQNVTITAAVANDSHSHNWSNISGKPTSIAGYGITDAYSQTEVDNLINAVVTGIDRKEAVATYTDLATIYPTPEHGWSVAVLDENNVYFYDGTQWIIISGGEVPLASSVVAGQMSAAHFNKVEGIEAGATADQTPAEILAAVKTVDGSGSGLDADFVRGVGINTANTPNSIVQRDGFGNINANGLGLSGDVNAAGAVNRSGGGTGFSQTNDLSNLTFNVGTTSDAGLMRLFEADGTEFFRVDALAGTATVNGSAAVNGGGQALTLGAGSVDHTYIGFKARTASGARSGFIGYATSGTNTMTFTNELAGAQSFTTNGSTWLTGLADGNAYIANSLGIGAPPTHDLHLVRDATTANIVAERTGIGASRGILQAGNGSVFVGALSSTPLNIGTGGLPAITIDTLQNVTFSGDVTTGDQLVNDHINVVGSGNARITVGNTSGVASGSFINLNAWDGSAVVSGARIVGLLTGGGALRFDTGSSLTASLTLNADQSAVFAGDVTVPNGSAFNVGGATDTLIGSLRNNLGVLELLADGTRDIQIGGSTGGTAIAIDTSDRSVDFSGDIVTDGLIRGGADTDTLIVAAGTSTGFGGNVLFYGAADPTAGGDTSFRSNSTPWLYHDVSFSKATLSADLDVAGDVLISQDDGTGALLDLFRHDVSITSGDIVGLISATGYDLSTKTEGARIEFEAAADWDGATPGYSATIINFYTQSNTGTDQIAAGPVLSLEADGRANFHGNTLKGVPSVIRGTSGNELVVSGGSDWNAGSGITLYGESHLTQANDIVLRTGITTRAQWNNNANYWDFHSNLLNNVSQVVMSSAGGIVRSVDNSSLSMSGGNSGSQGAVLTLTGSAHLTQPSEFIFKDGITRKLAYSSNVWDFNSTSLVGINTLAATSISEDGVTLAEKYSASTLLIKNAAYTAKAGEEIGVDCSGGAITITLPTSGLADGTYVRVGDITGNAATNNITVDCGSAGFNGVADEDFVIDMNNLSTGFIYHGSTWRLF